ncbi:hypothetical protein ACFWPV_15845 [Streptomyces uncialis]|uniref:hypothetical protein n=1 Tax=Streptomyces uncialis TaxID=1048205 RepID=UPI00365CA5F2
MGITPVLPVLRQLIDEDPKRVVTVLNVARNLAETPLWDEATALLARLPNSSHRLHLTAPEPGISLLTDARTGRPTESDVDELVGDGDLDVYLCGPEGFVGGLRKTLARAGVPEQRITDELFFSPRTGLSAGAAPSPAGPLRRPLHRLEHPHQLVRR